MKIKQEIDRILTEYNLERMSFDEIWGKFGVNLGGIARIL